MNHIKVKGLAKNYRKLIKQNFWRDLLRPQFEQVSAVSELDLEIKEGESVAFLGPNGAGKTTTIKMLSGLIYPSGGEIEVLGHLPQKRRPEFLRQIGIVMGSKNALEWDLTPEQNYKLQRTIYGIPVNDYNDRLSQLSEMLNITKVMNTQLRKLSLGERMKVELIGAILHQPKILFLDEPTVGLDITSRNTIRDFLRTIQQETKVTILLTSHDMDDVENVCDRVVVISKGRKVFDNDLQKLSARYSNQKFVKVTFKADTNMTLVSKIITNLEAKEESTKGLVKTISIEKSRLPQFLQQISVLEVDDIDIIPVPLERMIEDLFVA